MQLKSLFGDEMVSNNFLISPKVLFEDVPQPYKERKPKKEMSEFIQRKTRREKWQK